MHARSLYSRLFVIDRRNVLESAALASPYHIQNLLRHITFNICSTYAVSAVRLPDGTHLSFTPSCSINSAITSWSRGVLLSFASWRSRYSAQLNGLKLTVLIPLIRVTTFSQRTLRGKSLGSGYPLEFPLELLLQNYWRPV